MNRRAVLLANVALLAAVAGGGQIARGQAPASARFVVTRGNDTVATEEFTRGPSSLAGTVVSSNGVRTEYTAKLRADGSVEHIQAMRKAPQGSLGLGVDFTDTVAKVTATAGEQSQHADMIAPYKLVPYLDVSFALAEQIARATHLAVGQSAKVTLFRLGAADTSTITVSRIHTDSVTLAVGTRTARLALASNGDLVGAIMAANPSANPAAATKAPPQPWIVQRVAKP